MKSAIENTHEHHPAYGHKRVALELKINHKKILRIMHKYNIKPPLLWYSKKFTTQSDPDYQMEYKNLLHDMNMQEYGINDIWSSDLTYINSYINYQEKFSYLAVIQDIVSKEIVGFNISDKHDSNLVLKTLKEAVGYTKKTPKIFHSHRGREYMSTSCTEFIESLNNTISVSDPGSPWQNAWSESFFSRFKNDRVLSADLIR